MTAAVGGFAAGLGEANARAFGGQSLTPALSLGQLKPTGALDEAYWWKVRSQFNVVDGLTFMNNGTYGPTPRVVVDAFRRYNDLLAEDPTNNYWNEGRRRGAQADGRLRRRHRRRDRADPQHQ